MITRYLARRNGSGSSRRNLAWAFGPGIRSFSSGATLLNRRPRNAKIDIPIVQCVDKDNKLRPPEPLENILKTINPRTHFVELVQEDPPIVKIGDKEADRISRRAARKKERESRMERKEIQMTWNVSDADLDHKIKKAREQLERKNLVDFAFAPKAKQQLPPVAVMEEKLKKVVDSLQDIASERQERTLDRGVGIIFLRLDTTKTGEGE